MVLCGVCIIVFTLSVFSTSSRARSARRGCGCSRSTTGFFAWGVFVGMAAATRRNDHFYLTEITKRMTRRASAPSIEIVNRLVVLVVARAAWSGSATKNAMLDLGSYRMPSLIPLDRLHGDRADRRRADRPVHDRAAGQRLAERLRGARGPRRLARGVVDMSNGGVLFLMARPVPGLRLHGRAGRRSR